MFEIPPEETTLRSADFDQVDFARLPGSRRDRTMLGVEEVAPCANHGQDGVTGCGMNDETLAVTGAQENVWNHTDHSTENIYPEKSQEESCTEHRAYLATSRLRRAGTEEYRTAGTQWLAVASMNGCCKPPNSTKGVTEPATARTQSVTNDTHVQICGSVAKEVITSKIREQRCENGEVQASRTKSVDRVLNGHSRTDSKSIPNGKIRPYQGGEQLPENLHVDKFAVQDFSAKRKATSSVPTANENFDYCSPPKKRYTSYLARGHVASAVPQEAAHSGQHTVPPVCTNALHPASGQENKSTVRTQTVNSSVRKAQTSQPGDKPMYPETKTEGMEQLQPGGLVFTPFQPTIQIEVPAVLMFHPQQIPLSLPCSSQQVSQQPVITLNSECRPVPNDVPNDVPQMMMQNISSHQLPVEAKLAQQSTPPAESVQPQILSFEMLLKGNGLVQNIHVRHMHGGYSSGYPGDDTVPLSTNTLVVSFPGQGVADSTVMTGGGQVMIGAVRVVIGVVRVVMEVARVVIGVVRVVMEVARVVIGVVRVVMEVARVVIGVVRVVMEVARVVIGVVRVVMEVARVVIGVVRVVMEVARVVIGVVRVVMEVARVVIEVVRVDMEVARVVIEVVWVFMEVVRVVIGVVRVDMEVVRVVIRVVRVEMEVARVVIGGEMGIAFWRGEVTGSEP
uniref:Uncharacterized protein n=1 Tax=Branchiostoma floridae TaxID=7739 RepID=C3Z7Y9_BRAFL|eukprot:XP_002595291.1 hypothetical protein BRAFLDRAFT_96824 [Branchiostoma floridae]